MPTGALADRIGPRRVLTRIVLWWSAFTALTGAATRYFPLLLIRFLFGAGEAGAFPTGSVVVSRWFPPTQRATMSGITLMASQIGGAVAPLLVVPIQIRYGWRASFFVCGLLGVVWATIWYGWFRDSPAEKSGVRDEERSTRTLLRGSGRHRFPWGAIFHSKSALALLGVPFCYVYVYNFFQTWFHTFLVKGRGFTEESLLLSALPYVVAALTNVAGGAVSDGLVRRLGVKNGRRSVGVVALAAAGIFTIGAMITQQQMLTVIFLTLVYASITFQQSGVFGVCLDIGQKHAGAVVGLMNTTAQVGGLLGSVAYGYIVERFGSYDAPFIPMAALLFLGALLWLKIDASRELHAEPQVAHVPVSV
jgi:MFS family permease